MGGKWGPKRSIAVPGADQPEIIGARRVRSCDRGRRPRQVGEGLRLRSTFASMVLTAGVSPFELVRITT
jgi:hypothetical protein